jgi:hypothetical protein
VIRTILAGSVLAAALFFDRRRPTGCADRNNAFGSTIMWPQCQTMPLLGQRRSLPGVFGSADSAAAGSWSAHKLLITS